ncbi:MAG: Rrf2 family transcriptional regulator [Candidatus Cloacimonetes bacterium]|jgi:Rrf2 family protein|nr:Rrf2 family transcriptional regulator [Candidatus Cloacimonadota bacterium]
MQITTKTEYSLRALCELCFREKPVSLRIIADTQRLPLKYLEHLFRDLKSNDIVRSISGAKGGYILNKNAENITLFDILQAVEKEISPNPCACSLDTPYCIGLPCKFHDVWEKINLQIFEYYKKITLSEICKEIKE